MRIGLDARLLETHRPGVNRYACNILRALAEGGEHDYVCFVEKRVRPDLPQTGCFRQAPVRSLGPQSFSTLFDFGLRVRRERLDLLHSLFPLSPLLPGCPSVVTLHDFQPVVVPGLRQRHPAYRSRRSRPHQKAIDLFYAFTYARALKRAGAIISISRHTHEQLRELYPGQEGKSRVIHYGLEAKFRPISDPALLDPVRKKYSLPERFVLYAGTNRPNKNLPRLFQAVGRLNRSGAGVALVLAGFEHPAYPSARDLAAAEGISGDVRHIGEVSHDELPAFYNLARVAVLVSFLEGFGFPALEAMACGTPLVAAADSSLPEVVGNAGLLVNPFDAAAIADALSLLWRDEPLRRGYARAGIDRARSFSWERAARETARVYSDLISGGPPPAPESMP